MKRIAALIIPAVLLIWSSAAQATPTTIDLRNDAVTTFISSFGVPNTASYGQLVTAPDGTAQITSFSFRVENIPATATFRGEVYAWDATEKRATGEALFESGPQHTTGTEVQDVSFDTGNTRVQPGVQYVLFMSVSKDFELNTNFSSKFRALSGPESEMKYPQGEFVFLNNGTEEEKWTTQAWSRIKEDLQFTARFTPDQTLSIAKSGAGTVSGSAGGIDCGSKCSASLPEGTQVTLTATPDAGQTFLGFSGGGCSGSGPCQVTLNEALTVKAEFADKTAPQPLLVKRTKGKIFFDSSEAGSTFQCQLDQGKFKPCQSPFSIKGLKPGGHIFAVIATDAAGNASAAKQFKFRVAKKHRHHRQHGKHKGASQGGSPKPPSH